MNKNSRIVLVILLFGLTVFFLLNYNPPGSASRSHESNVPAIMIVEAKGPLLQAPLMITAMGLDDRLANGELRILTEKLNTFLNKPGAGLINAKVNLADGQTFTLDSMQMVFTGDTVLAGSIPDGAQFSDIAPGKRPGKIFTNDSAAANVTVSAQLKAINVGGGIERAFEVDGKYKSIITARGETILVPLVCYVGDAQLKMFTSQTTTFWSPTWWNLWHTENKTIMHEPIIRSVIAWGPLAGKG